MSGTNGYGEEARGHDQICCLVDDGKRCARRAGNASYSKRIQKTVQQRRLKLNIDHSVCNVCTLLSYRATCRRVWVLDVHCSRLFPVSSPHFLLKISRNKSVFESSKTFLLFLSSQNSQTPWHQRRANPHNFKSKSKSGLTFKSKPKSTLPKKFKSKSTLFKNDQIQIRGFKSKSTNPDLKIVTFPTGPYATAVILM